MKLIQKLIIVVFLLQTYALNAQHLLAGAIYFVASHVSNERSYNQQKGSLSQGYKTFIGAGINTKTKYFLAEIFWSERKSLKLDNSYGISHYITDSTKYNNNELGLSLKMLTNSASQTKLIFLLGSDIVAKAYQSVHKIYNGSSMAWGTSHSKESYTSHWKYYGVRLNLGLGFHPHISEHYKLGIFLCMNPGVTSNLFTTDFGLTVHLMRLNAFNKKEKSAALAP